MAATNTKRIVYIVDCAGNRPKVRPREVALACADYGILVEKAVWRHWGDATATASVVLTENDCTPNCADGTFHSEPATVRVSIVEKRYGRYEYRHIRVVPSPPNRHHFLTLGLTIPG